MDYDQSYIIRLQQFLSTYTLNYTIVDQPPTALPTMYGNTVYHFEQRSSIINVMMEMSAIDELMKLEKLRNELQEEERIRSLNTSAQEAWDHYQTLINLVK